MSVLGPSVLETGRAPSRAGVLPESLPHIDGRAGAGQGQGTGRGTDKGMPRTYRVKRCAENSRFGAHPDHCRALLYTEEEFRAACQRAGKEPGHGWLARPEVQVGARVAARFRELAAGIGRPIL